jgi:hypothetical protein
MGIHQLWPFGNMMRAHLILRDHIFRETHCEFPVKFISQQSQSIDLTVEQLDSARNVDLA